VGGIPRVERNVLNAVEVSPNYGVGLDELELVEVGESG
jgi:hypothetical protein